MESILNNDVTILCGETGSGKTTQVPQFLYEAGFGDPRHPKFPGMIGVTQPRRVAAVSMAKRVAEEMNLKNGEVAYQIRYDADSVRPCTRIKFMTDGILLRELSSAASPSNGSSSGGLGGVEERDEANAKGTKKGGKKKSTTNNNSSAVSDLLLTKYSCIIIDEAHERTVGTDVLIGWLARICRLRNTYLFDGVKRPLKLVIMSATLRVEDFSENKVLFPGPKRPPVLKVDGRQYKVTIHYNRRTPELDYVTEAYKKVCKIHRRLPRGGILVFLTGQQEIQVLVRKLRKRFSAQKPALETNTTSDTTRELERKVLTDRVEETETIASEKGETGFFDDAEGADSDDNESESDFGHSDNGRDDFDDGDMIEDADEESDSEEEEVEVLDGMSDDEDDEEMEERDDDDDDGDGAPLHVLPLYSLLSTPAQMRVFEEPPPGHRLCVVATNVAETSLTIPGIRYVVDCGKVKERTYDPQTGVQTFRITWTSKASADQRAGRAGRISSGHCYRLFSSAVFNDYFPLYAKPEIERVPLESVVLQMKGMGIRKVVGFPFPTPPGKEVLREAERVLVFLGALEFGKEGVGVGTGVEEGGEKEAKDPPRITELGRLMANFPVSPRLAKMLIVAAQQRPPSTSSKPSPLLAFMISIVSGLSVGDPFIRDEDILGKVDADVLGGKDGDDDEDVKKKKKNKEEEKKEKEVMEARKKKRAEFARVMQMFSGKEPTSDAIRLLGAIGAYVSERLRRLNTPTPTSLDAFCDRLFIRSKAMEEITKLRSQLTRLIQTTLGSSPSNSELYPAVQDLERLDPMMRPPTPKELTILRQILLSGYPDHVAVLDDAFVVQGKGGKGKVRAANPVYRSMWFNEDVGLRIHPSSCLFRARPAPAWVVYDELVGKEERIAADNSAILSLRGEKVSTDGAAAKTLLWMKGITSITPSWIPTIAPPSLCIPGKLLETPEPRYDNSTDAVVGFHKPRYGPKRWDLPVVQDVVIPLGKDGVACRSFAIALLEGKVELCRSSEKGIKKGKSSKKTAELEKQSEMDSNLFALLEPYLVSKPSTMSKPWGRTQSRVQTLLSVLMSQGVISREALLQQWLAPNTSASSTTKRSTFLLDAYLSWLPLDLHPIIREHWPPVLVGTEMEVDEESGKPRKVVVARVNEEMVRRVREVVGKGKGEGKVDVDVRDNESEDDSDF
ncbi:ATP-dependent RNA helicase dhx37 [Quaeritorhiza haematococci]|nr:ATP-dependent RNA helicase dhx37 [Quaeritorhiza haematococci]